MLLEQNSPEVGSSHYWRTLHPCSALSISRTRAALTQITKCWVGKPHNKTWCRTEKEQRDFDHIWSWPLWRNCPSIAWFQMIPWNYYFKYPKGKSKGHFRKDSWEELGRLFHIKKTFLVQLQYTKCCNRHLAGRKVIKIQSLSTKPHDPMCN